MPDNDYDPELMAKNLKPWDPEAALESLTDEASLMDEGQQDHARRLFRENLPLAAMSVIHMARFSPNERTRLDAAKYVVERVLGKVGEDMSLEKDPFLAFLEDCTVEVAAGAVLARDANGVLGGAASFPVDPDAGSDQGGNG